MTKNDVVKLLNGSEYPLKLSKELKTELAANGLVIVYGASDDLMGLDGAISDEVSCYDGGTAYLTSDGLLQNDCDDEDCPYFAKIKEKAATIEAIYYKDGIEWTYKTDIPHETFEVMEDGRVYCRGIVFRLNDVALSNIAPRGGGEWKLKYFTGLALLFGGH